MEAQMAQSASNHLQLYSSGYSTPATSSMGPSDSSATQGPTTHGPGLIPNADEPQKQGQTTLSYRDASQILLHSKTPSYKYAGNTQIPNSEGMVGFVNSQLL